MGLFSNKETPESLKRKFSDYFNLFDNTCLGYVFKFYDNDGKDIVFKENTKSRKVLLKRNFERIELTIIDKNSNVIFSKHKIVYRSDDDGVVIKAIHELYVIEMP